MDVARGVRHKGEERDKLTEYGMGKEEVFTLKQAASEWWAVVG